MKTRILLFVVTAVLLGPMARAGDVAATPKHYFLGILHLRAEFYPESSWTQEAGDAVGRHFVRLQENAKAGKVVIAGRTDEANDRTMGIIIFEAASLEEAQKFMEGDPAVLAGIMTAEVRPFGVAVSRYAKAAEPGATDNPDNAPRVRED